VQGVQPLRRFLLCLGLLAALAGPAYPVDLIIKDAPVQVYFSPHGGCTDALVKAIDQATQSILVQAYSFTSRPIAEALVRAHSRGVNVQVIADKSQEHATATVVGELKVAGITVTFDESYAIAHNKVMVIDDATVVTGSFNFTAAAENSNAENLLIVKDADLAKQYLENWEKHREHSVER